MGLFSSGPDLNDVIFQLRMSSKQLEREAKRAAKEEAGMFFRGDRKTVQNFCFFN